MSDQESDTESDIMRVIEKQILRRPASVSCEARTPRGSAGSQPEDLKQNGAGKSKKGKNLEKGKMEIFQIMSDLDPMSQTNLKSEKRKKEKSDREVKEFQTKSYSTTECATIQKSDAKETQVVPKLETQEIINESNFPEKSSTTRKSSVPEHVNTDIYERLQALETSLSALTPRAYTDNHVGPYLQRQNELTYSKSSGRHLADISFHSEDPDKMVNLTATTPRLEHPTNAAACVNKAATDYAVFLKDSALPGTVANSYSASIPTAGHLHNPGNLPNGSNGYLHGPDKIPSCSTAYLQNPHSLPSSRNGYLHNPGNVPSTGYLQHPISHQPITSTGSPQISSQLHNHDNHQLIRNGNFSHMNNGQIWLQSITSNGQIPTHGQSQLNGQFESTAKQYQVNTMSRGPLAQPVDLKMDTQTLLYRLQQDMISHERECSLMLNRNQQDLSRVFNPANQQYQSAVNQSSIPRSQFPVSHTTNIQSETQHEMSSTAQSETGDFSHDRSRSPQIQQQQQNQHCYNCNSNTTIPANFTKHQLNRLDFTQPEPSTNLTLLVDATRLYIHKEVMSAWSNRWRHLVHVNSTAGDQIILRDTKLQTVLHLLQFVYGTHKVVTDANVYSLLELGDKFEMPKIKSECEAFLLVKESSLKLLVAAQNFRLQQLYKKCLETVTRQDLQTLERNPMFSQLNATTTASIYKAEILRLRSVARASEQNQMKTQMQVRKLRNKEEKVLRQLEEVGEQWAVNRNRCFKHGIHVRSDFDFSCAECNKRVQHQIKQLCKKSETLQASGLDNVSLISDDVNCKEY